MDLSLCDLDDQNPATTVHISYSYSGCLPEANYPFKFGRFLILIILFSSFKKLHWARMSVETLKLQLLNLIGINN